MEAFLLERLRKIVLGELSKERIKLKMKKVGR